MGVFVGPPRVVQARRPDPREDIVDVASDRQPDVDVSDRVERGRGVAGRVDGLVDAQGLQPIGQGVRQVRRGRDRPESPAAGLQAASDRGVVQLLAHLAPTRDASGPVGWPTGDAASSDEAARRSRLRAAAFLQKVCDPRSQFTIPCMKEISRPDPAPPVVAAAMTRISGPRRCALPRRIPRRVLDVVRQLS